jgi:hypothetical protein
MKKRIQNSKRRQLEHNEDVEKDADSAETAAGADEGPVDEEMMDHLQMVTSLIEGRDVTREEIETMMAELLRQHSIGQRRGIDYLVEELNKDPPEVEDAS